MTRRQCRITVAGVLSDRFDSAFDGISLERTVGTTVLRGVVRDSSALYGLIGQVQDLGLELLSMESQPADPAAPAAGTSTTPSGGNREHA